MWRLSYQWNVSRPRNETDLSADQAAQAVGHEDQRPICGIRGATETREPVAQVGCVSFHRPLGEFIAEVQLSDIGIIAKSQDPSVGDVLAEEGFWP
jgi:hypothetical protein